VVHSCLQQLRFEILEIGAHRNRQCEQRLDVVSEIDFLFSLQPPKLVRDVPLE
jgi:hypothetical protein